MIYTRGAKGGEGAVYHGGRGSEEETPRAPAA